MSLNWNFNRPVWATYGFFLGGIFLFLGGGFSQEQNFFGKNIQSVQVECPASRLCREAHRFFEKEVTGLLTQSLLSRTIKEFYLKGPVHSIEVEAQSVESSPDQVQLRIRLVLQAMVISTAFSGNQEISKKDLRNQLDLRRGDYFVPSQLPQIERRMQTYYQFRGFPKANIQPHWIQKQSSLRGDLKISIEEGEPCQLEQIQWSPKPSLLEEKKFQKYFTVRKGDRCDAEKISLGARNLQNHLREDGFSSVEVSDPELVFSPEGKTAKLFVNVISGPIIQVRFHGNTFSFERDSVLKKVTQFSEERQFNHNWVESTAKQGILEFYKSKGFVQASLEVQDVFLKETNLRKIDFFIHRGPRFYLGEVSFEGLKEIPISEMKKKFQLYALEETRKKIFVFSELDLMTEAFRSSLQSLGYLRARVDSPVISFREEERKADVVYRFQEGKKSILSRYEFHGNQFFSNYELENQLPVKHGEPIHLVALQKAAQEIEAKYRLSGFKLASVQLPPLKEIPEGEGVYSLSVSEGPRIRIGNIRIHGNWTTQERVIRRELTIREGDFYHPEKIRESRGKLLRLGFFESVSIEESLKSPSEGKENLVISVVERKKRSIKLRPGFSTDEGIRGAMEFGYINFGGTGRSLTASGKINRQIKNADITEHQVILTYLEPHLLGMLDGKLIYLDERSEEQQFDMDRRGVIAALEKELFSGFRTTFQWELEFRKPFHEMPGAVLSPIDEQAARFGSLGTILDLDRRNDLLNATRGSFHRLQFEFFNSHLLSDEDFARVLLRNNFYFPLYRRIRSILSVRMGFSATYGDTQKRGITQIPIEKRFRLGGNTSLRGFPRNCIGGLSSGVPENCSDEFLSQAPGGNSMFNYMFEILLPLFGDVDLALFTDGGNAFPSNSDFSLFNIRTTAGVGLRYNTFFGPLRLDVGFVLDRRTGEGLSEIHFAVGQF